MCITLHTHTTAAGRQAGKKTRASGWGECEQDAPSPWLEGSYSMGETSQEKHGGNTSDRECREYIWLQKLSSLNPGLAPSMLGLTTEGWPWGCPNPDVLCPSTNFAPRRPLTKHHFHVLFDCQQAAPGCLLKEAEQKRTRWSVWRRTEARPSNCGPGASPKRQSQLKAPGVLPESHGWPSQSTPAPAPHG